jgi:hypothetical protein
MKPRYSLRAALCIITVGFLVCMWWDRPRATAERFVSAIKNNDFASADEMFVDDFHRFAVEFMEDDRNVIEVVRLPQSFKQWLGGECRVAIRLHEKRSIEPETLLIHAFATPRGIEPEIQNRISDKYVTYAPNGVTKQRVAR